MALFEEENFPRGGKIKASSFKRPREDDNLFSTNEAPKTKKNRKETLTKRNKFTDDSFLSSLNINGTLSYRRIQEGMIILGCIRRITEFSLEVELPGFTSGHVKITNISDPFTKYLNTIVDNNNDDDDDESDDILKRFFQVGEFVVVKVVSIEHGETRPHVDCTMNPKEINRDKSHTSFQKGMLAWGCIKSVLDHGYEASLGISNCRVFLPSKNVDEGWKIAIGKPLWCAIHKNETSGVVTTLRISIKEQHLKDTRIDEISNLHDFLPGMQVEMISEKITSSGIYGTISNNYFAYLDESYLESPMKKSTDYREGKLLKAYVLYIEPTLKIVFLSLRDMEIVQSPLYENGKVLTAEVLKQTNKGLYLKLPKDEKAFVANKRLVDSLSSKPSLDLSQSIHEKFPPGSKHKCRILNYDHMSKLYIATLEQKIVKEKIFNFRDLAIGQLVKVTVEEVKPEGLVVSTGYVRGFVPNIHISNVKYSDNIKKKFIKGYTSNARVLIVLENNVIFTLKTAMVESETCLASLEQAKRGERYPGVIVCTRIAGVLVLFYNDIKGWLSRNYLTENREENLNPTEYFYIGQVVTPWIQGVKEDRIILSLTQPSETIKYKSLSVGKIVKGIVHKVHQNRLDIRTKNGKILGTVPLNHLSSALDLCPAILKTYKPGDKITELLCIDNRPKPNVLSRREALAFARTDKLEKFEYLKAGHLIRCSYVSSCELGIYVLPLILDYTENVLVVTKEIVSKGKPLPKFAHHQSLVAKVLSVTQEPKSLGLTIKFEEVFDYRVESVIALLSERLSDIRYLNNFGRANGWNLCEYRPGERVKCTVEKLGKEGGCLVTLPNKTQGLVPPKLCPDNLEPGQNINGVFLDVDFKDNYAEICLLPNLSKMINKSQTGVLKFSKLSSFIAYNVIIKNNMVICVLKTIEGNKQFVYLPLYLHENDCKGTREYYEKKKFKVCVYGKVEDTLIGINRKLLIHLEKQSIVTMPRDVKEKKKKKKSENQTKKVLNQKNTVIKVDNNSNGNIEEEFKPVPRLSEISSYFNPVVDKENVSSSDEDEQPETARKKRKLTPTDRAELARQEEERISKIENELADPNKAPENAEQFDRFVLAVPNSSELWIKYMAFHISATEFDKARAVARRALQAINMTLIDERLNVWIALLNLENMFGTKESFEKTFEEAIKLNDSLSVYLKTIQLLADSNKLADMEEKVSKLRAKYKQEPKMWLELARTYYQLNDFRQARNLKDMSLKSIDNKKTQLELILRFAIMEFKYGEEDHGAAIFETVLSSDPRKVNVWTIYVDQLVKKGRIEQARKVLERAVSQKLSAKIMKTLFLKFRVFEEQHGDENAVRDVKEKAREYVSKLGKIKHLV